MSLKIGGRRRSRSRKHAPRRIQSFEKLNEEIGSPFSAVLDSKVLKKPVKKFVRTIKKSLGGKRRKKTYRRKCR